MSKTHKHDGAALPDGWRMVRLGDVAEIRFSNVDKRTSPDETRVRLCNYTDVFYNRRITAGMDLMEASATDAERTKWQLQQGDVLFTKDSETPDEIGIPTLVAEDMPDVLCGYHLGLARPHDGLVEGSFLAIALASTSCRRSFARVANGVTRFGLTLGATKSIPVVLPPLPEQRAIADLLDSIDDAIERTEAVIAATETLRDSLLHELLTRGVPGWHTEWKDMPGIGIIPADWEVVRLGEVSTVERGKFAHRPRNEPKFYGGDIPFIQTSDIVRSVGVIRNHSQTLNELGLSISRLFPAGTVVITIAANIGETAITGYPMAFPDSLVGITPTGIDGRFLEYYLRTQKETLQRFAPESAQKNINLDDLRPMLVPVPAMGEQAVIVEQLRVLQDEVDSLRELLAVTQTFKDSAADEFLSGWARP